MMDKKKLIEAETVLGECRYLGPTVRAYGACHVDSFSQEPFEMLISSIISQQLSVKAASTIEGRVKKLVGESFKPKKLMAAQHQALRDCGLSNRKAEYIAGIARAVHEKSLDFDPLVSLSDQEVIKELVKLRGVGQWTAEMLMIFSLGRMDVFSSRDVGLQRGMRHLFGEKADTLVQMGKLAERWQPYRSVASWYLWKIVD